MALMTAVWWSVQASRYSSHILYTHTHTLHTLCRHNLSGGVSGVQCCLSSGGAASRFGSLPAVLLILAKSIYMCVHTSANYLPLFPSYPPPLSLLPCINQYSCSPSSFFTYSSVVLPSSLSLLPYIH